MKEASLVLTVTGTKGKQVKEHQEETQHESHASVIGAGETLLP